MTFSPEPLVKIQNNFTKLVSLDPLYQNCTNGFALLNKRAARAPDKKYLLKTPPPEPLVQIKGYFTELLLMMPSTKIAQMVTLHRTMGLPEL